MTKREKELKLLRNRIARMEAQREAAIKTLVRVETTLPGLRHKAKKLVDRVLSRKAKHGELGEMLTAVDMKEELADRGPLTKQEVRDRVLNNPVLPPEDDGIPGFLRRGMAAQKAADEVIHAHENTLAVASVATALAPDIAKAAYAVANAHNKLPTEEDKKLVAKEKRAVHEEHKHAELTGKRRKWPATGKAAANLLK